MRGWAAASGGEGGAKAAKEVQECGGEGEDGEQNAPLQRVGAPGARVARTGEGGGNDEGGREDPMGRGAEYPCIRRHRTGRRR